jgi:hypothetical protein
MATTMTMYQFFDIGIDVINGVSRATELNRALDAMVTEAASRARTVPSAATVQLMLDKYRRASRTHAKEASNATMHDIFNKHPFIDIPRTQRTDAQLSVLLRIVYAFVYAEWLNSGSLCSICRAAFDDEDATIEHSPIAHVTQQRLLSAAFDIDATSCLDEVMDAIKVNCSIACKSCNSAHTVNVHTVLTAHEVEHFYSSICITTAQVQTLTTRYCDGV